MTCEKCQTVNTADSRFCKGCGAALQAICSACGTANTPDSRFCKFCGVALSAVASAAPVATAVASALANNGMTVAVPREKVAQVVAVLGGLNCGRCGYRTCAENAMAIVRGESPPDSCVQGGAEVARQIREILGETKRTPLGSLIWEQLTSIKLAIGLLIALALISVIGTLIPQNQNPFIYVERYGLPGAQIIQFLQLDRLYSSWYFLGLLVLLVINTVCCAIKRFRVSWEMVRKPVEPRPLDEITKLPTHSKLELGEGGLERLAQLLERRRYRVGRTGAQLTAYKHLWGRLGVDLLHVSLLIVLIGGIVGGLLGFEEFQVAHKGETFHVARGGFDVRVDDLWTTSYSDSAQIKDWHTKLTVIDNGKEVLTKTIEVNEPLTYKGITFYQSSFGTDWLGGAHLTLRVERAQPDGTTLPLGEFTAKVGEEFTIDDEGRRVKLSAFFPDFMIGEDRRPANRSGRLNNPAVFLEVFRGEQREFATWTFAQFPEFQHEFTKENPYRFFVTGMTAPEFTGLQIAANPGIPLIYTGFILMVLGLFMNFYLPPRRIWAAYQESKLYVGGLGREPREFEPELEEIVEELKFNPHPNPLPERERAKGEGEDSAKEKPKTSVTLSK
ncbi:MAG: cytochrome c biogenesis protein ResB [Candidatus Bipolaricaulota bacterium]|nr:cytochrome c biogenesis protein ResB [Candidatus Bipolaricaulota bacterium]